MLVDQQDPGNSDVFVDARTVFDGRRLHGPANRFLLLKLLIRAATERRPTQFDI
jgi:hypothetical protein